MTALSEIYLNNLVTAALLRGEGALDLFSLLLGVSKLQNNPVGGARLGPVLPNMAAA